MERRVRLLLVAIILSCLAWLNRDSILALLGLGDKPPAAAPRAITPRGDLAADEAATVEIFETAAPSVVYVTTIGVRLRPFDLQPFEVPEGTGTGFIWDTQGHIVTNFHVIARIAQSGGTCEVTLEDQSIWVAEIRGAAPDQDLAVLRINAPKEKLTPIAVGTSHDLEVGQKVFAIGNPFGYDHTLTAGIVASLHREITAMTGRTIGDVIQTDAAINPGNSGGPLLDSAGRLIGVATAIRAKAQNIGFAIPVDTVNRVVPELIERGRMERPGLGIVLLLDAWAWQLGIDRGVVVRQVGEGTAAERAGLRTPQADAFDIILEIEGKPVNSTDDIHREIGKYKVGQTIELLILRDDQEMRLKVTLQPLD